MIKLKLNRLTELNKDNLKDFRDMTRKVTHYKAQHSEGCGDKRCCMYSVNAVRIFESTKYIVKNAGHKKGSQGFSVYCFSDSQLLESSPRGQVPVF